MEYEDIDHQQVEQSINSLYSTDEKGNASHIKNFNSTVKSTIIQKDPKSQPFNSQNNGDLDKYLFGSDERDTQESDLTEYIQQLENMVETAQLGRTTVNKNNDRLYYNQDIDYESLRREKIAESLSLRVFWSFINQDPTNPNAKAVQNLAILDSVKSEYLKKPKQNHVRIYITEICNF